MNIVRLHCLTRPTVNMILHRNETEYKALKATNKESKKIKKIFAHSTKFPIAKRFHNEPSVGETSCHGCTDGVDLFYGVIWDLLSLFFYLIALLPQVPRALCTGGTITIQKVNGLSNGRWTQSFLNLKDGEKYMVNGWGEQIELVLTLTSSYS